ncbi:MAG: FtsX-like permease family protein [Rhodothermales bacterium]
MRAIDRKMLRDLWGMRGQALAIAVVIVSGVTTFVTMTATMQTLQRTLTSYYSEYRFADLFASVRRAPETLYETLRGVEGVGQVMTRVTAGVNLEIDGFDEPVSGLLVSIPEGRQPALNRLYIREGRLVELGREDEVLANEVFAEAHGLRPGDRITAVINGRRKALRIVGIALSPEYLMQVQPGSLFPDPQRFGVLWMGHEALSAAYDMGGAFNDVAFTLAPGADEKRVLDRLDEILETYGGVGAVGRMEQPSHFYITEEFRQLRTMATMLPVIFLAVAAFLLNIVVTRLIGTQREQIAVLKAFGYSNGDVGWHYLKLVFVVAVAGAIVGTLAGLRLGRGMGNLYLEFYRFPYLDYYLTPSVVISAVALTMGATFLGVFRAVRRAVQLPPAEAMRPAPPASYKPTLVERIGLQPYLDQPTRMILRNLGRQPMKAFLTVLGIASSCAILIMGLFMSGAFDYIIRVQYGIAQRDDLTITFAEPTSTKSLYELESLPGVIAAEPFRAAPVKLRHRHWTYDTAVQGIPQDAYLRRIIDTELHPVAIPEQGMVLTERLAEILHVSPGDVVVVEVQEGRRLIREVPVVGLTRQYLGVAAYMDLDAVNRLAGGGQALSGVLLTTDRDQEDVLTKLLQRRPRVIGIVAQERAVASFMETSAESMLTFTFILSFFAGVIAFGVVYNSARIALSERDRELASLRVLGFTRGEIAYILLGELGVLTLMAIPLGFLIGTVITAGIVQGLQTDLYQIPMVLDNKTFALSATVVLASTAISAVIVRRKLNKLDLVGVLKTRE